MLYSIRVYKRLNVFCDGGAANDRQNVVLSSPFNAVNLRRKASSIMIQLTSNDDSMIIKKRSDDNSLIKP